MTMSAGRCCPLVTLTMSPTATQWAGAALQEHEEGENEIKKETTVFGNKKGEATHSRMYKNQEKVKTKQQ